MTQIYDGGPAFPHLHNTCQRVNESEHHEGLSIRDYFADSAMQAMVSSFRGTSASTHTDGETTTTSAAEIGLLADYTEDGVNAFTIIEDVAATAYMIADIMLAARTRTVTPTVVNARLLAACKEALADRFGADDPCVDGDPITNKLRSAIAAAEGDAQ